MAGREPPSKREPANSPAKRRAAEYVRMSTDHQKYSTENQSDAIRKYAEERGFELVRSYADAGKSGLRIEGREALQQLIQDVQDGTADFEVILVYDVSRWGRFQDADESAYYEYICRRANKQVEYCAEQFENDGGPVATIVKSVKRAMAGEYSRELSNKVFIGQCRLIERGFRQGGAAGFGLRRVLLDERGEVKAELKRGEHKSLQTDRVILVPGPDAEVRTVRWIYSRFLKHGRSESEIAAELNERGILTDLGRAWTRATVHQILTNEKYIGNNVYNRRSFKLKQKRVANGPEMWIRSEGAFDAIVEPLWRETGHGHGTTLVVTEAGLLAIGIEPVAVKTIVASHGGASAQPEVKHPNLRRGTKQALLITMLRRAEGATMPEIVAAIGWQAHSARGAMSGALGKKLGLVVVSARDDARGRVYRIALPA
jgi:DNA invertase Pin-like site-specific DNA recombinase